MSDSQEKKEDGKAADEGNTRSASQITAKAMKAMGLKVDKGPSVAGIEKKEDFTELSKVQIAEATVLAENGELDRAIELLLSLEKKCRLGNDIMSLTRTVVAMITLCHERGDWAKLNTTVGIINRRHQQSKHAIIAIIDKAMEWVDQTPGKEERKALITALRDVTEGKIYVEAQRAKLTRQLAIMLEDEGKTAEACDAMLDVYVETYGALSKREKIDFILDQIRLTIAKQDWVRVLIVAKKIQMKILNEPDLQDLKLRFHKLMIEYYMHEKDAFELANAYYELATTPCVEEDNSDGLTGWKFHLKACVLFLILSKHTNHQSDMLHRVAGEKRLPKLPEWKQTIGLFTTPEIIGFPLPHQALVEELIKTICEGQKGDDLFPYWRRQTHERTTQHNLRVAAKYYKRIHTTRLAQLIGLTVDETETQLASLVSDGALYAKIDRPDGVVTFKPKVTAEETLSAWSSDIGQLLSLVERTCHLINKEHMIHKL